jgi:hypothetical protein
MRVDGGAASGGRHGVQANRGSFYRGQGQEMASNDDLKDKWKTFGDEQAPSVITAAPLRGPEWTSRSSTSGKRVSGAT